MLSVLEMHGYAIYVWSSVGVVIFGLGIMTYKSYRDYVRLKTLLHKRQAHVHTE